MKKGCVDPVDPKNLIREAFRIEGIGYPECRTIFLDWALSLDADQCPRAAIDVLLRRYDTGVAGGVRADHPMRQVLTEGLEPPPARGRGDARAARRRARKGDGGGQEHM